MQLYTVAKDYGSNVIQHLTPIAVLDEILGDNGQAWDIQQELTGDETPTGMWSAYTQIGGLEDMKRVFGTLVKASDRTTATDLIANAVVNRSHALPTRIRLLTDEAFDAMQR